MVENKQPLIRIINLSHYFPLKKKSVFQKERLYVRANEDINLTIYQGETFGLVGESGCGKTTLGRVLLQLYSQTVGKVLYYGKTLEEFKPRYVRRTIKDLAKIVSAYQQLSKELGDELARKAKEDKHVRKVVQRYADAVRLGGGLLLAADLASVSQALMAEYDAGVVHFTLTHQLANLTLRRNLLVNNMDKTSGDKKELAEYDEEMAVLQVKADAAEKALAEKRDVVNGLRAMHAGIEGFAELDKQLDQGIDLAQLTAKEMRGLRKEMQVVFQDPYSSLNPRLTVGQLIGEALTAHKIFKRRSQLLENYVVDVMDKCGLQKYMLHRYPHEFSGGQRQRIGIARALSLMPKFVVCDEAVSALDVSIQSQIINLLMDLKDEDDLTYLFITHDLSTVKFISDRICVMYLGTMMELASSDKIFKDPLHPYTEALMEAIPTTEDESKRELVTIQGEIPSPIFPPSGCKFHTRCKYATEKCQRDVPQWRELKPGHFVACHYPLDRGEIVDQRIKGAPVQG